MDQYAEAKVRTRRWLELELMADALLDDMAELNIVETIGFTQRHMARLCRWFSR